MAAARALAELSRIGHSGAVGNPRWPSTDTDGSVRVAACFAVRDAEGIAALRRERVAYLAGKQESGVDPLSDLRSLPSLEVDENGADVRVVVHGRTVSTRWKDWLVELTVSLRNGAGNQAAFIGFFDCIAGRFHPASLSSGTAADHRNICRSVRRCRRGAAIGSSLCAWTVRCLSSASAARASLWCPIWWVCGN
jgi:hypothetical protein